MRKRFGLPLSLYYRLKLWTAIRQIVRDTAAVAWPDVIRKKPKCSSKELIEYARVRAGQLVHPRIDGLLKKYPRISGALGSYLLAYASRRVENLIVQKLARLSASNRSRKAA